EARLDHGRGHGEGPEEAPEPVRVRATGLEDPFEELREGARMAPPDRVAPGAVLRPRRASSEDRSRTRARVPGEARVHHRASARAPGRTAEAVAHGRGASEA